MASYFYGSLDETRIYNRALSPREVRDLYNWAPSPVAYYDFEDASGQSTIDKSGNSNTGTLGANSSVASDDPTWSIGKYGKGLNFDGGDFTKVSDSNSLDFGTGEFTASTWVKFSNSPSSRLIYKYNSDTTRGFMLTTDGSNRPYFNTFSTGGATDAFAQGSTALNDNQWHYVTGTRSGTTLYLYVDGKLVNSATGSSSDISGATAMYIGSSLGSSSFLTGSMEDVKIYNYARTAKQIVEDMNGGHPAGGSPVGSQVGYWKFDEGYGAVANDQTPNRNNGTITNATWNNNGKFGKALRFNGSTNSVSVSSIANVGAVSFWVNPATTTQSLLALNGSAYITASSGTITATGFTSPTIYVNGIASTSLSANQWSHVVVTTGTGITASALTIGRANSASLTGLIDEVKIYNYALTVDEVALDYNHGLALALGGSNTTPTAIAADTFTTASSTTTEGYPTYTWTGSTWTVAGGTVSNSPTQGSELLTDGGLETWTSATDLTSWTETLGGTSTVNREATTIHGGTYSSRLDVDASGNSVYINQTGTTATGTWMIVSGWIRSSASGKTYRVEPLKGDNTAYMLGYAPTARDQGTTYTQYFSSGRTADATWRVRGISSTSTSSSGYFDDISIKELTLASLFRTINASKPDVTVEAAVTMTAGTQAGLVLNLDSTSSPANFIVVYHNGTNVLVDEAVAGVYTNKASTAATYSAGAVLRAIKSGNSLEVYYNNVKVGSTLTMTSNSNTNHGLFSTYSGNTFDNFSLQSSHVDYSYCVPGSTDLCSAPVGEWNFEEGSGSSAQDSSGGGSTGTITGATYVPSKQGKALNFNGGTDTVTVSNSLSTKSIEFWVYPNTTTQNLIDLRTAATAASISVSSGTISATGFTSPTIYVNGIVSSTLVANVWQQITIATGTAITANAIQFGRISSTSLTGKLDSIRIFDYARTPAQVAWDYNKGAPVARYKFDECQGSTINDASGNGNAGTITIGASGTQTAVGTCTTSGAWFGGATGKYNSSLNFDGTDDQVKVTAPSILPSAAQPFTSSLWFKSTSSTSNLYLMQWGAQSANHMSSLIYQGATNSFSHAFYSNDLNSGTNTVTNGAWNHVVATFDGTTRRLYVNGILKNSDSPASVNVTANQDLYIGCAFTTAATAYFPGQIDDARIYNYALTGTQVKMLFNENSSVRFGP